MIRGSARAASLRALATVSFAIALMPGCALLGFAPDGAHEQWRALPDGDPRPALYLEALARDGDARRALRGRARLILDAPDLNFRRPQRIALERPDKLRVEVIGLFGQIAAVVASDGERVSVFDASTGSIQEGPLEDDLLWRVARIALEPSEAAALLVGIAPAFEAGADGAPASFATAEISASGGIRLRSSRTLPGGVDASLEFDDRGRLVAVSRGAEANGETLEWSARFHDFRDPNLNAPSEAREDAVAWERFPFAIDLVFPAHGATARVEYDAVELADSLPDDLFVLQLAR